MPLASGQSMPNYIYTLAGNGFVGSSGDGGVATLAQLNKPCGVGYNWDSTIFIVDQINYQIRRVTMDGMIEKVLGSSANNANCGQSSTAIGVSAGMWFDGTGTILVATYDCNWVSRIDSSGQVSRAVGKGGVKPSSGDGGDALSAYLNDPVDVTTDSVGNIFVVERAGCRVRKVTITNIITTFAGTGVATYNGDHIAATSANLNNPTGIRIASDGSAYISDTLNHRIRKVLPNNTIITVAGNGTAGFGGDGGPANLAQLNSPTGLFLDSLNNLYIADSGNNRVRVIWLNGTITTVVGNGSKVYTEGVPALQAGLVDPRFITGRQDGSLILSDSGGNRVYRINLNLQPPVIPMLVATPTPGPTKTPATCTVTPTPSPTDVSTQTPTPTPTPTETPSLTPSPMATPTQTPTLTPTTSPTPSSTQTPTPTATSTQTSTPSPFPTATLTPSPTPTPTPTSTPTSTEEPTPTPAPSDTQTPTPTPTDTLTPTPSPSLTPSETPSPSPFDTPTETPTLSPSLSDTPTPTPTPTPTETLIPSPTPSETLTPSPSDTPTPTPTETSTPTPTPSSTPSPANDPPSDTPTPTLTPSVTPTPTSSPSDTPTPNETSTPAPSETPSEVPSATRTPTEEPTPSPTPFIFASWHDLSPSILSLSSDYPPFLHLEGSNFSELHAPFTCGFSFSQPNVTCTQHLACAIPLPGFAVFSGNDTGLVEGWSLSPQLNRTEIRVGPGQILHAGSVLCPVPLIDEWEVSEPLRAKIFLISDVLGRIPFEGELGSDTVTFSSPNESPKELMQSQPILTATQTTGIAAASAGAFLLVLLISILAKRKRTDVIITLCGGMFGAHHFLSKPPNKKRGFLYLFTFGLFGIGWMWDLLVITKEKRLASQKSSADLIEHGISFSNLYDLQRASDSTEGSPSIAPLLLQTPTHTATTLFGGGSSTPPTPAPLLAYRGSLRLSATEVADKASSISDLRRPSLLSGGAKHSPLQYSVRPRSNTDSPQRTGISPTFAFPPSPVTALTPLSEQFIDSPGTPESPQAGAFPSKPVPLPPKFSLGPPSRSQLDPPKRQSIFTPTQPSQNFAEAQMRQNIMQMLTLSSKATAIVVETVDSPDALGPVAKALKSAPKAAVAKAAPDMQTPSLLKQDVLLSTRPGLRDFEVTANPPPNQLVAKAELLKSASLPPTVSPSRVVLDGGPPPALFDLN